ncbi:MAG: M48 family metalloprotease [Vitreimonas sp.]
MLGIAPASAQGLIRDAEIEGTLRAYAIPLFRAADLAPSDVRIYIVDSPSINAFVAGGQNIYVHSGLVLAAQSPNEIIGVLAHETGHVAGGHLARSRVAMNRSIRPMLVSIGLGVLAIAAGAPDAGAALIAGAYQFAMADFVGFTQVQESAADQAGLSYLETSGQSGSGLLTFFNDHLRPYEFMTQRMPAYMRTHPYSSDRVEALRQRVEAGEHREAVDSEENLRRFRFMQAKLVGFIQTQSQTLARYPVSDTSAPARYARAVAYYRASDLGRARSELGALIADDPRNAYFQELMGQILFENGRAMDAIPFHRRSVELAENQPLLQINLARALTAAHAEAGAGEAIELLQAAIAHEPDNAFAWRELASAWDLRGEQGLAELASAEQNYALRQFGRAIYFAERARRTIPPNTPSYQRANDIVMFAANQIDDGAARLQLARAQ